MNPTYLAPCLLLAALAVDPNFAPSQDGAKKPATSPARPGKGEGAESKSASRPGATAADARLTKKEREHVLETLAKAQKETLDAVSGLSDAQWSFKPAPDKWSVGECVEHLLLIEEKRTPALESQLKEKPEEGWAAKTTANTEVLETALVNRSFKVKALEEFTPAGKLARAEALERYKKARAKTVELASNAEAPFKSHFAQHPFFGALNGYQVVLVIGLHNMRHNQQIAEVMADAGFPKK